MPPRPDPYSKRQGKGANLNLPSVKDPTPKGVAGGGGVGGQDYTKYIKWTSTRIAIFSVCVVTPYLIAVAALWLKFGFGAALGLLAVGVCLGLFIALMYWFARATL